jgi:hypothetical protein
MAKPAGCLFCAVMCLGINGEELTEHISINQCGNAKDKISSLTNNYRMRNL